MRTGMKAERLRQMEEYIAQKEFVTVEELSDRFSIHKNTVRSDINELAEKGIVDKQYGGISYKSYVVPTTYEERREVGIESKRIIGRLAAALLQEDDVIYVDSGTTASALFSEVELLPSKLTIITNSLPVINWTFAKTGYNVYVLPGKAERSLSSFASLETIESARTYNIQKAFMGVRGISLEGDLSSASQIDARIKTAVVQHSQQKILMAEARKINHTALVNYASLSDFDMWVCDSDESIVKDLAKRNDIKLIVPENRAE